MGFLASLLAGIFPMLFYAWILYWLDRYEKEPAALLGGVFSWGVAIAAGGAFFINTVLGVSVYALTQSQAFADLTMGSLVAPLVEESLKGMAVLLVFLIFHSEFDSLLDGIIYGGITALGFAAAENTYYIYTYGFLEDGWGGLMQLIFIRVILVGWQHPFYTAFIGMGVAVARLNKGPFFKVGMPVVGWAVAVFTHSLHNTVAVLIPGVAGLMIGTFLDWSGWLGLFVVILWATQREKKWIKTHLSSEVEAQIITPEQYHIASSAWRQMATRAQAIFKAKYRPTNRFYQLCGELALKKYQFRKFGEERGNSETITKLQNEMQELSGELRAAL
ncbi:MAG: Protease PrsW [Chloroflexi bacterium]|nr:Protease PrsW [Chloroflexota bacterium]